MMRIWYTLCIFSVKLETLQQFKQVFAAELNNFVVLFLSLASGDYFILKSDKLRWD